MFSSLSPALALLCVSTAVAQLPAPVLTPRVAPRAHWVASGAANLPATRTSNPGAASADKMYVFGGRLGNNSSTLLNDLHEFDGSAWTVRNADGAPGAPPRRGRACVAWNDTSNTLVVFGGEGTGGVLLNDVWEWDPLTNTWTDVTPASGPMPVPRRWSAMAYDPATTGMLVFGGRDGAGELGDTWLFVGGTWAQIATPMTAPPTRRQHSMMTRPDFGDVVMCGGQDTSTSPATRLLDVWRWDGGAWSEIVATTPAVPASGVANQAVYDSVRQRIVMQGGNGNSTFGGGAIYGTQYGGSPTDWCSEFDCLTDEWLLYGGASATTNDPVIGRKSRYFAAFVPALSKVYMVSGQPATRAATYEYQATPIASTGSVGAGCNGVTLTSSDAPWTGRNFSFTAGGLQSGSLVAAFIGFTTLPTPVPITPVPFPGCATLLVSTVVTVPMANAGGSATSGFALGDDPATVALTPFIQVIQVETSGPVISNISSSSALALIPGAL